MRTLPQRARLPARSRPRQRLHRPWRGATGLHSLHRDDRHAENRERVLFRYRLHRLHGRPVRGWGPSLCRASRLQAARGGHLHHAGPAIGARRSESGVRLETLDALAGTPIHDVARRAVAAVAALIRPVEYLADYASTEGVVFETGVSTSTSVLRRPILGDSTSPAAWHTMFLRPDRPLLPFDLRMVRDSPSRYMAKGVILPMAGQGWTEPPAQRHARPHPPTRCSLRGEGGDDTDAIIIERPSAVPGRGSRTDPRQLLGRGSPHERATEKARTGRRPSAVLRRGSRTDPRPLPGRGSPGACWYRGRNSRCRFHRSNPQCSSSRGGPPWHGALRLRRPPSYLAATSMVRASRWLCSLSRRGRPMSFVPQPSERMLIDPALVWRG